MRLLFAFCVGIAAVVAWQSSYGDVAKGMIASAYPELGWLVAQSGVAPTTPSHHAEEVKALSLTVATMRQRLDQLAARQDQSVRDISTKLEVAKQEILGKIPAPSPRPVANPTRNPAQPPSAER